jgi:hypothetical protein
MRLDLILSPTLYYAPTDADLPLRVKGCLILLEMDQDPDCRQIHFGNIFRRLFEKVFGEGLQSFD